MDERSASAVPVGTGCTPAYVGLGAEVEEWKRRALAAEAEARQLRMVLEASRGPAEPVGCGSCPVTGLPFYDNMEHPERGMIAMYGGPLDVYSIPELQDNDGELRRERYDLDADNWVEGGEPLGYFYGEQQPEAKSGPIAAGAELATVALEYVAARDAHEQATSPLNSHAPVRQLAHGSPITRRWVDAREALRLALTDASPKRADAREALAIAYRHLDVESLRVSHCNDLAKIHAAMLTTSHGAEVGRG